MSDHTGEGNDTRDSNVDMSGSLGPSYNNSGTINIHVNELVEYDVTTLTENPYIGLRAFTYEFRARFGGRSTDIREAVQRLTLTGGKVSPIFVTAPRFVTGSSGIGKSSFVMAGLVPALEEHYAKRNIILRHTLFRPMASPMANLRYALGELHLPGNDHSEADIGEILRRTPLHQLNVIIADQLEECFVQSNADEQKSLLNWLLHLPPFDEGRTYVIATLRSDFLGELFEKETLFKTWLENRLELRGMNEGELREAIVKPIIAVYPSAKKKMQDELINALIAAVGEEFTLLPLLQVTLEELWRGGKLTLGAFKGLATTLQRRADNVLNYVDHERSQPAKLRAQEDRDAILDIFCELVAPAIGDRGISKYVRLSRPKDAVTYNVAQRIRLVDELTDARLLSTEAAHVDIVHETLLTKWETLARALEAHESRLRQRARFEQRKREWLEFDRQSNRLLTGVDFAEAEALEAGNDIAFRGRANADGREFLAASRALADAKRTQQLRVARGIAAGFGVLTLFVSIAGIFAFQQRAQAVVARATAIAGQSLAESASVAQSSRAIQAQNPSEARRLALKAWEVSQSQEAEQAMRDTLSSVALHVLAGHRGIVGSAQFSPDSEWLVTTGWTTARIWNVQTGAQDTVWEIPQPIAANSEAVFATQAVFRPGEEQVVTASQDGIIRIWRRGQSTPLAQLHVSKSPINSISLSPDGSRLLEAAGGIAKIWQLDAKTLEQALDVAGHASAVSWSSHLDMLAVGTREGNVALYHASSGTYTAVATLVTSGEVSSVDLSFVSDDQVLLAAGDATGAFSLWNLTWDGQTIVIEQQALRHFPARIAHVDIAPDISTVLIAAGKRPALIPIHLGPGELLATEGERELDGHGESIVAASFSPDGRFVATGSNDLTARIWDLQASEEMPLSVGGGAIKVLSIAVLEDTVAIASGIDANQLVITHLGDSRTLTPVVGIEGSIQALGLTANGRRAIALVEGSLVDVDTVFGTAKPLNLSPEAIDIFGLASNGDFLVAVSGITVSLWSINDIPPRLLATTSFGQPIKHVALSQTGKALALATASEIIRANSVLSVTARVHTHTIGIDGVEWTGVALFGDADPIFAAFGSGVVAIDSEGRSTQLFKLDNSSTVLSHLCVGKGGDVVTLANARARQIGTGQIGTAWLLRRTKSGWTALRLNGAAGLVTSCVFETTRRIVFVGGDDGVARSYYVEKQDVADVLRQRASRQ